MEGRLARLKSEVNEILSTSNVPLSDIVREQILPRLPVQTLLRFKTVCKDWNNITSVPLFRYFQSRTHRTASGVFQRLIPGFPAYLPFDPLAGGIPDPFLSFLPIAPFLKIIASCHGLLCCAGSSGSYYVCNPSTAEWADVSLPSEANNWPASVDALVFDPSARNIENDYWLVRVCQMVDDRSGVFGFQVFSSATGQWRVSSEMCAVENLIEESGVSAGGLAYWRTTMTTVLSYDPVNDACSVFPWPKGNDPTAAWQLGEIGGRLCCTCVTATAVEVYARASPEHWALLGSVKIVGGKGGEVGVESATKKTVLRCVPRPLRFQSGEPVVLLWISTGIFGLDLSTGRMRKVSLAADHRWTSQYADFVPHISSFARVKRSSTRGKGRWKWVVYG